ncbi:MAG: hypothetical protein A3B22_00360 [Candidatus Zambryskibacteria bacterium RIFCSPLOWO2_01_FULL_47_33]|nr:MAG: hypothetical protein A3B22_00360 [Candidatus Zambryskibacteria bacterium RIFCSPLOWO2_01_FULL_47_33]
MDKLVPEKFVPLVDLGVITVPEVHRLATFSRENRKRFIYYEAAITDDHFRNPTRILKPGDRLEVRAFRQVVPGMTTSEERLAFCRRQDGNVFVGAQGASLVFDQKRHLLPKGLWYSFLDQKERLWKDARGCYGVPNLVALRGGDWDFDLRCFEQPRDDSYVFFAFRDLSG